MIYMMRDLSYLFGNSPPLSVSVSLLSLCRLDEALLRTSLEELQKREVLVYVYVRMCVYVYMCICVCVCACV